MAESYKQLHSEGRAIAKEVKPGSKKSKDQPRLTGPRAFSTGCTLGRTSTVTAHQFPQPIAGEIWVPHPRLPMDWMEKI